MNLEFLGFRYTAGAYPVAFLEQRSFLIGVFFISHFMADLFADRLTFHAAAPFGNLNVFAAVSNHDESSNGSKCFGFRLESRKKVSS